MSTSEIKARLIDKINSTGDKRILLEASRLLEIQISEVEKPFTLTEEMNDAIDEAEIQIKEGDTINHEKANTEINKWLKE